MAHREQQFGFWPCQHGNVRKGHRTNHIHVTSGIQQITEVIQNVMNQPTDDLFDVSALNPDRRGQRFSILNVVTDSSDDLFDAGLIQ
jgi:hypothetical protein